MISINRIILYRLFWNLLLLHMISGAFFPFECAFLIHWFDYASFFSLVVVGLLELWDPLGVPWMTDTQRQITQIFLFNFGCHSLPETYLTPLACAWQGCREMGRTTEMGQGGWKTVNMTILLGDPSLGSLSQRDTGSLPLCETFCLLWASIPGLLFRLGTLLLASSSRSHDSSSCQTPGQC